MQNQTILKSVREWPAAERPREKLLERGAEALSDAELLAVLLRSGMPGKDVVKFSRELVGRFGGLRGLSQQNVHNLSIIKGLGPSKIACLLAAGELAKRQFKEQIVFTRIKDPGAVVEYLRYALRDRDKEVFKVFYLNKANCLIGEEDLFYGTVDEAAVYPREIVAAALRKHATAVILAHNHPSGRVEPSREDIEITKKIKTACETVSIKVLDHIVVSRNDYFSFNEHGLI